MKRSRYALAPDAIEAVGVALYGQHWQRPLARNLGVTDMSVRRWYTQQHTVPAGMIVSMAELLSTRQALLSATYELLRRSMGEPR